MKSWKVANDVYTCFFDLEKLYDRVPCENVGARCGITAPLCGRPLLAASKPLYSCSDVCVRFCGVESQPFSIIVALRQECVLLPLHFVFYMNGGGVRQSHQESTRLSLLGTAKPIVYFWQMIWYCLHSRVVNEPHFEASPNQA